MNELDLGKPAFISPLEKTDAVDEVLWMRDTFSLELIPKFWIGFLLRNQVRVDRELWT